MKADDIPLAERRRVELEQAAEIRAALVRRHFQVAEEQSAIDFALACRDMRLLPEVLAQLERLTAKHAAKVVVPVAAPAEPMPAVEPLVPPLPARPATALPGLRANLGLK